MDILYIQTHYSYYIFIAVKPLVVNITNKRFHLSALRTYEIECETSGSKPAAVFTWYKGIHPIIHMARTVSISSANGRLSFSTYRTSPLRRDGMDSEFFVVRRQFEHHEKCAELRADHRGRRKISDVPGGE